jgi:hypothetical protein
LKAYDDGASVVAVVKDKALKEQWIAAGAVDMDQHDLRFLDPPNSFGVLTAKGSAKRETNGFVLETGPNGRIPRISMRVANRAVSSLAA